MPAPHYDAQSQWKTVVRAFHATIGQKQQAQPEIEAKPIIPEGFMPKPGPQIPNIPVPATHQQLFAQGVLPSPDSLVQPSDRVKSLYSELLELSQFEIVQLTNVLHKSYGVDSRGLAGGYGLGGGGFLTQGQPQAAPQAAQAAAAQPAVATDEKKEAEKPAQTAFSVRLDGFDAANKIKVIKEVRAATGLGLKESKELVEGAPKFVKRDLSKADCDALIAKLKEAGAKVTVE